MAKAKADKYTVIRDTREQLGWTFHPSDVLEGMIDQKMDTGDYTVKGYENILTIERKRNTAEICNNLFDDGRFYRELERMRGFKYPFVVYEFTLADVLLYPKFSGMPASKQHYTRVTGLMLLKRLIETQIKFPYIQYVFAGNYGKEYTLSLIKRVIDAEKLS
jgi:hypothetical protein